MSNINPKWDSYQPLVKANLKVKSQPETEQIDGFPMAFQGWHTSWGIPLSISGSASPFRLRVSVMMG